MNSSRRRLLTALWRLRVFVAGGATLALLGIGAIIRRLTAAAAPVEIRIAGAIWAIALLGVAAAAIVFLIKANGILRHMARLGGSFSPNTPAPTASGGKKEEKKNG
jgi:hypothetical protein